MHHNNQTNKHIGIWTVSPAVCKQRLSAETNFKISLSALHFQMQIQAGPEISGHGIL